MKRISIMILFAVLLTSVFGQNSEKLFTVRDTIVGKSQITGQSIIAKKHAPTSRIIGWHWDGQTDNLLLELRITNNDMKSHNNNALLAMFDLNTKQVKWTRQINGKSSEIKLQENNYFLSEKKNNFRIHPETGNVLWENRNEFYFIAPHMNIGIGYPLRSYSNKLTAVDLSTGKELWKIKIDRTNGWDDAYMLNDTTLLIAADGIKAVNLTNGASWVHNANTSKKEIGKMVGINVAGIILGIFTGVMVYQTEPDVTSNMVSNMLIDPQENTLLASRNHIFKVDRSGNKIWSTDLPKKESSSSSIFQIDSVVYLINKGYGEYNGRFSIVGNPYFAAFDSQNGKRLFSTPIAEKNDFIRTFQAVDDRLFLVFKNRIIAYSLTDGSIITETAIELQEGELPDKFVESGIYRKVNGNRFQELASDFSNHNLMMTSRGRIFILTDNLEALYVYEKDDLYQEKIANTDYKLISNNDSDYLILDDSGSQLATLKTSADMFINNNKLVFIDKDAVWEMDLDKTQHSFTSPLWQSILENLSGYVSLKNN